MELEDLLPWRCFLECWPSVSTEKGTDLLRYISVHGKIILKWILKLNSRSCTVFIKLRKCPVAVPLKTCSKREILMSTTVSLKMTVFWDAGPCRVLWSDRRFRSTCCFHHRWKFSNSGFKISFNIILSCPHTCIKIFSSPPVYISYTLTITTINVGCLLTLAHYAFPRRYEFGERRWNDIGRGKLNNAREKPVPVPLCPPQIPNELTGREPGHPRWEAGG
jgi:hypothetical protein